MGREGALQCMVELRVVMLETVVALTSLIRENNALTEALRSGTVVMDILHSRNAAQTVDVMTAMTAKLESARHNARVAMFGAAIEEGATIADLARVTGMSRQLASRYVQEARSQGWD